MACSSVDQALLIVLLGLVVVSLVATWWHSSLVKLLAIRHPVAHSILGQPELPQKVGSDLHAIALVRFLVLGEYKQLNDPSVETHARVLQACLVASVLCLAGLIALLLTSKSPSSTVTLQCLWRG
jgi:hypothetical protein